MTEEEKTITPDNVFDVDVKGLALNSRFGSLIFENANKKLSNAQSALKEVTDLGYEDLLLEDDINKVNQYVAELAQNLEWLRNFDISTIPNAKDEHDNFENKIDAYFNQVYKHVVMDYLQFLRGERQRDQNPGQQELEEEVRKTSKLRAKLEEELANVQTDIEKIRKTGKDLGSAKGERAATKLASHFAEETLEYQGKADKWFIAVVLGYVVVLGTLASFVLLYIFNKTELLSPEIAISKLVLAAALWYGLSFIIKNYNVNSHLAAINRHRAAVARTLEDFLSLEQQQENPRLTEILQNSTEAMFKNAPVGFITKAEKEGSQPVLKIVNDIIGIKD